ncbi:MAG: carboxypeptidase-like regulatory domain-containing protein, partial [Chlorobiales bacterium]|nr:carboxypeptidase-like regulatory domain-containing protein [Chlorobiales bacterium]
MKHQLEIIIFLACFCLSSLHIQAKTTINISGSIRDEESTESIPFSNIAILRLPDSTLIKGSSSDFNGNFSINITNSGSNILRISVIGYESKSIALDFQGSIDSLKLGNVYLKQKAILLDEIVTIGEQIKAKSESNKTTYYINKKITDASNTGMDVIKHVPGIQVDLMQNISLDGNQNISILVDGKERDRHFLSQIDVSKIDKLEVIRSPGSEYDANITGIINIVSKNKEESGINGQLLLDIPASGKEIYSFPNYNITYCIKNLSIYTSYNGELNYFDIEEYKFWRFLNHDNLDYYQSTYKLRQKNESHRFHFGVDYLFKNNNELGIYVNLNPYSSELDGNIESIVNFSNNHFSGYNANKDDTDKNLSHFISFFYKHHFNSKNELSADFSLYGLNAENLTTYIGNFYNTEQNIINNDIEASQHKMNLKIDVKTTINEKMVLKSGLKI